MREHIASSMVDAGTVLIIITPRLAYRWNNREHGATQVRPVQRIFSMHNQGGVFVIQIKKAARLKM